MDRKFVALFLAEAQRRTTSPVTDLLIPMAAIFFIMYFVWLRPQRKKDKARQEMLDKLKKNDRVVTAGGIHGEVISVKGTYAVVKVDPVKDVKMKFSRSAISRIVGASGDDDEEDEKK